MPRHFAYYRQSDGSYSRELLIDGGGPPAWWARLPAAVRARLVTRWSHRRARPAFGEVAIDVTSYDYPVGDFCWSVLRVGLGEDGRPLLDFPQVRTFLQVERTTGQLVAWLRSPRPCRSTAARLVVDVTGLPWESAYGTWGRFVHYVDAGYAFLPDETRTPRALAEAAANLNPFDLTPDRVGVEV